VYEGNMEGANERRIVHDDAVKKKADFEEYGWFAADIRNRHCVAKKRGWKGCLKSPLNFASAQHITTKPIATRIHNFSSRT